MVLLEGGEKMQGVEGRMPNMVRASPESPCVIQLASFMVERTEPAPAQRERQCDTRATNLKLALSILRQVVASKSHERKARAHLNVADFLCRVIRYSVAD